MKITTFLVNLKNRLRLINDGRMTRGKGGDVYDGVNVKDILENTIKKLNDNPDIDVMNEIKKYFQKAERYYLFDGKKMLFGLIDRAINKPFEYDVTELFFNTLNELIISGNESLDDFKHSLNNKIKETEEYKEVQLLMKEWGY